MKLRSSEIIYNQIKYDPRFDETEFTIGYQTRFNGMKEIRLTSFKPGLEIPWQRPCPTGAFYGQESNLVL